ncbi:MAG: hypothetical protein LBR56_08315, partial [Sporomusaceae bacterium]|nr:hypothetical protein [Sporomusaceae bacterium]
MDVKNFAVNLANLAKTTVFTGENNVAGKQGSPKTNNFYDKLNNAVERSEKINTNGEADLQAAETLEKNPVLPDENIVLEEDAPEDAVATDAEDKPLIAVDAPIIDNIPVVTAEMPIVSGTVPVVNAEAPVVVNGTAPVIAEPPANNAGATVVVANILAQLDPFQPQANAVTTGKAALYAAAEQSQHVLPEQQIVDPKTGMLSAAEETTLLDPLIGAKTAKPQQIIHPGTIPHNMIAGDETPQPNAPATPAAAKGELPLFL